MYLQKIFYELENYDETNPESIVDDIKSIVDNIKKNWYRKEATFILLPGDIPIAVNKNTTYNSFRIQKDATKNATPEYIKHYRKLMQKAAADREKNNPKDAATIDQQNISDSQLIDSVYFHNIDKSINSLKSIPMKIFYDPVTYDEKIINSIVDDIKKNNYANGTTFILLHGTIPIPVNEETTYDDFMKAKKTAEENAIADERSDKEIRLQKATEWANEHPKEYDTILQQKTLDSQLIDSVYFHNIDEFINALKSIPTNISKTEKCTQVITLMAKIPDLADFYPYKDNSEADQQYRHQIREILKDLGFEKQEFSGLTYSESCKQSDDKYAIDVINNILGSNSHLSLFLVSIFINHALTWLNLRTPNSEPLNLDIKDPRPSFKKIEYTNATGETKTLIPGSDYRYKRDMINYDYEYREILTAQHIQRFEQVHIKGFKQEHITDPTM
jgi:hypothetical protein